MNKFQNKYRIDTTRLQKRDYGNVGYYFVTICAKNRISQPFGNIINGEVKLSKLGELVNNYRYNIKNVYLDVELDQFVIMPDHIHGIIVITKKLNGEKWNENRFGIQKMNLGSIIRGFKGRVKSFANKNNIDFERQSRYYDRVIRNEIELGKIQQYIVDNPLKWEFQKEDSIRM